MMKSNNNFLLKDNCYQGLIIYTSNIYVCVVHTAQTPQAVIWQLNIQVNLYQY